jgi:hypothetical protein
MLTFDPWKKRVFQSGLRNFSRCCLLDIGAQCHRHRADIIAFDITSFPGVDLVGDGLNIPIQSNSVDGIINTGVLGMSDHPADGQEIYRA